MEPESGWVGEGGVGHWYLTQHGQYTLMFFLPEVHSDKGNEADWEKAWEGQVALLFSRGFSILPGGETCGERDVFAC